MNDLSQLKRYIREQIAQQLNVILSGAAGLDNDQQTETIDNLFPGSPSIPERPVMHPFGVVSRAPAGTIQVVAKQGSDPSNRIVLGHRDSNRPELERGEAMLYSAAGWRVHASSEGVVISGGEGPTAVTMTLDAEGLAIELGTSGKFSVTSSAPGPAAGELIDALVKIMTGSTAGGFPFVPNAAGLQILQGLLRS